MSASTFNCKVLQLTYIITWHSTPFNEEKAREPLPYIKMKPIYLRWLFLTQHLIPYGRAVSYRYLILQVPLSHDVRSPVKQCSGSTVTFVCFLNVSVPCLVKMAASPQEPSCPPTREQKGGFAFPASQRNRPTCCYSLWCLRPGTHPASFRLLCFWFTVQGPWCPALVSPKPSTSSSTGQRALHLKRKTR